MSSKSNRTRGCIGCGRNFSFPTKEKPHDRCPQCFRLWKQTRKSKAVVAK